MTRPPLHADSWITQEQADELDASLVTYLAANQDMLDAERALNDLVVLASAGSATDEAVDVFNDGLRKKREECTVPSGLGLNAFKPPGKKKPRRAVPHDKGEDKVAGRRHVNAIASVAQMKAVERSSLARRKTYNDRTTAAQTLNILVTQLSFPVAAQLRPGQVVNVWADGRKMFKTHAFVPPGLRMTKMKHA